MNRPGFTTAIPKRRYSIESFIAVLLGDLEATDSREYAFVLALVKDGETQPQLYVTAERLRRSEANQGRYRMRLFTASSISDLDDSDDWGDADRFAETALRVAASVLGLGDAVAMRLT
ncbi:MAG: hypothetical protein KDH88_13625 [Chromatiales bacterium]|nr:hypothetical protein [Chromatiales bacterium]